MTEPRPRLGIAGFIGLFGEGAGLLRGSPRLWRSFLLWEIGGLVGTVAASVGVGVLNGGGEVPMGIGAVAWWAFLSLFMLGGATMLVDPAGKRIDYYGIPNGLSAIRAWACLPLILVASVSLPHNLSFILWCSVGGVTGMLDFVDGWVARRVGPITEMGKAFDPAMDALFFTMAGFGAVLVGILPVWFAWMIGVRYLGPLLLTPVVLLMHRRPELVHTEWGRRNTALIGFDVFVLMWIRIAGGATAIPALVLALTTIVPTFVIHCVQLVDRVRRAPVVR